MVRLFKPSEHVFKCILSDDIIEAISAGKKYPACNIKEPSKKLAAA